MPGTKHIPRAGFCVGRDPPNLDGFCRITFVVGVIHCAPAVGRCAFQSANFAARGMSRDRGNSTSTSATPCGRPISSIRLRRGCTSRFANSRKTLRRLREILRPAVICRWKSGSSGGPPILLMKLRRGRTSRLISSSRVKRRCVGRSLVMWPAYRVRRLSSSRFVVQRFE
jgi:hypothetical protein